jgi:hypothetical protein
MTPGSQTGVSWGAIPATGLAVWLKADSITGVANGAKVSTWNDSSANGNGATQGASSRLLKKQA